MFPVLFELGSIRIDSFGVAMSLAFVVAGLVMQRDFAPTNRPPDLAWSIVAYGLIGGLLGARLHQALFPRPLFVSDPLRFIFSQSGLVWYGGVLGGVIATLWPIQRAHVRYASVLDTAALGLAIGLATRRSGSPVSGAGRPGT